MTASARVEAPWTADQVKVLNRYQSTGTMHPYTCGRRGEPEHRQRAGQDLGQLVATFHGWICLDCDYKQTWTHAMSLENWTPEEPTKEQGQHGEEGTG